MLAQAIDAAGTADDVVKIAYELEGMEYDSIWGSKVMMREKDHQAIQDIHISEHTKEGISFPYDNSDCATTCEMKRP